MALQLETVPEKAIVVRRGNVIVAASWFGPGVMRPFIYPFLGPGDRELTRIGHPLDPVGHSHHRSIWIGHHDVSGSNFWEEAPGRGRIEQKSAAIATGSGDEVKAVLECEWKREDGKAVLLETRELAFQDLGRGELGLEIVSELRPAGQEPVILADTPFGLLGIRVARTLRVAEGLGGLILNSQEAENEKGCFWQHAEWCDYSGPVPLSREPAKGEPEPPPAGPPVIPAAILGISCFNHPSNSPEDTIWHVRDDGWMGPCISKGAPRTIEAGSALRARYRIEAHAGRASDARVGERYRIWRGRK